jgi:hypothetical protein
MDTSRSSSLFALALSGAFLHAQEQGADKVLQQAQVRLDKALAQAAAATNGTFAARWDVTPGGNGIIVVFAGRPGAAQPEASCKATGCWQDDLLSVHFDSGDHEVLQRGRRTVVRSGKGAWVLSRDRMPDGSSRPFIPDPSQLAVLLTQVHAKVTHREVGTVDERPMETLTVILSGDDAVTAMLSGLLPPVNSGMIMFAMGAAPPPQPTLIDLAFSLDPATATLHRIEVRIHSDASAQAAGAGRVRVLAAGGGAVVAQQAEQAEEEDTGKLTFTEAVKQVPDKFQDGLPVRKLKDCNTTRFTLRVSDQGSTKAPAVDAAAAALLGR